MGFKTYIVSGLGQYFMRIYTQRVYGISSEQVLGSSVVTKYQIENGTPELMREPKLFLYANFGGKPVAIDLFIGKRPYAAFGNSTGDRQMLEWTGAGDGARLKILVHLTMRRGSTPMARQAGCPTPQSAHLTSR